MTESPLAPGEFCVQSEPDLNRKIHRHTPMQMVHWQIASIYTFTRFAVWGRYTHTVQILR